MKVWIALGVLILIIFGLNFAGAVFASKSCPKKTYGANDAVVVKYFSSPLCPSCWIQKPIIEEVASEHGNRFLLKEYNVDFCREAAAPHYVQAVPAFMVDGKLVYGVQSKDAMERMIA